MKKLLFISAAALLMTSCASTHSTYGVGFAAITMTKEPFAMGAHTTNATLKRGDASCTNVLGIVAIGDCSINSAARNGNISTIQHVDKEVVNILGIFGQTKTVVYGE